MTKKIAMSCKVEQNFSLQHFHLAMRHKQQDSCIKCGGFGELRKKPSTCAKLPNTQSVTHLYRAVATATRVSCRLWTVDIEVVSRQQVWKSGAAGLWRITGDCGRLSRWRYYVKRHFSHPHYLS